VTRSCSIPAAAILALVSMVAGASERVRAENGRLWIECRDASLSEVLREIAAVVPMEVWLDEGEGVEDERVSVSLAGATMKAAIEKIFEKSRLNYAVVFDPADGERIVKVYVGTGAGRLATPAEPEGALDPEVFLETAEAREALRELKGFLEEQKGALESSETSDSSEGVPSELEELLESILELPTGPEPLEPPEKAPPAPRAKEKEKPQL
jgi:hypothetical protein